MPYTRRAVRGVTRQRIRRMRMSRTGAMSVTRNCRTFYIGPGGGGGLAGTIQTAGATTLWSFGAPVASGGILPGLYDVPFAKAFQLNDLINFTDFQTMFDQYKIKRCVITARITALADTFAQGATQPVTAGSLLANPTLMWYNDMDDNAVPGVDDVRERMGVRMKQLIPGKTVRMSVSPRCDLPIYTAAGALTQAAVGKAGQWLDTAVSNLPHYGIKGCITQLDLRATAGSLPGYQISFETKYYLTLKDVR